VLARLPALRASDAPRPRRPARRLSPPASDKVWRPVPFVLRVTGGASSGAGLRGGCRRRDLRRGRTPAAILPSSSSADERERRRHPRRPRAATRGATRPRANRTRFNTARAGFAGCSGAAPRGAFARGRSARTSLDRHRPRGGGLQLGDDLVAGVTERLQVRGVELVDHAAHHAERLGSPRSPRPTCSRAGHRTGMALDAGRSPRPFGASLFSP